MVVISDGGGFEPSIRSESNKTVDLEFLTSMGMLRCRKLVKLAPHSRLPPSIKPENFEGDDIVITSNASGPQTGPYITTSTEPYLAHPKDWDHKAVLLLGGPQVRAFEPGRFFETIDVVADVTQYVPSPDKFSLFRARLVEVEDPKATPVASYVPERVYEAYRCFFDGSLYVVMRKDLERLFAPGIKAMRETHS